MTKILYTIPQAAEQVGVSPATISRAIKATDPNAYPPPLQAKNAGSDKKKSYRIEHRALEAWADSLKDA
jgi:DNA-binding MurR/RpiR family transcriptional regulator